MKGKAKPNASAMRAGSVRAGMEAKDKAADKKKGIRENSKRDLKMDSAAMMNLRSAVMGRKRGKK